MDDMYAGFAGAKNRPNQIAATLTERQSFCWLEGKHWTEMGAKPGKVQALVVEFSADCAAIRAKSGEGGYSEAAVSWRKGVYTSYTCDAITVCSRSD